MDRMDSMDAPYSETLPAVDIRRYNAGGRCNSRHKRISNMALRDNLLLSCLFLLVLPSPGSCVMAKAVKEEGYLEEDIEAASTTGLLEAAAALAPLGASPRKEHAVPPMESTRRSPGPSPGAAQQAMALWGSQGSAGGASATKTLGGRGAPSHRLQSPNVGRPSPPSFPSPLETPFLHTQS